MDERIFAVATAALFGSAMAVSVYYRSRAAGRQAESAGVREGGPLLIAVRLVFLVGMLGLIVSYVVHPGWVAWASLPLPDSLRIGAGVFVVGLIPCFVWLFRHIGENITPRAGTRAGHGLVVTGPYRWVRHPLYTVGLMFWLGMSVLAANWLLLIAVALAGVFLVVRIPREEAHLVNAFGDEYRRYMARTGRLLPRLRS